MAKDEPRTRRLVVATFSIIRLRVAAKYWLSVAGEYLKLSVCLFLCFFLVFLCFFVFYLFFIVFFVFLFFICFFVFHLFFFVFFLCFVTYVKCPLTYLTEL